MNRQICGAINICGNRTITASFLALKYPIRKYEKIYIENTRKYPNQMNRQICGGIDICGNRTITGSFLALSQEIFLTLHLSPK